MPVDSVIEPGGVATGGELYAVRQVPARLLRAHDPVHVSGFGGGTLPEPFTVTLVPLWAPVLACLVLLVLPAMLLLGTAAKLSGAVREHRVMLMFRMGARRSALRLSMMESALQVLPGVTAAVLVWLVLVGRLDRVPFVGSPLLHGAWVFSWPHVLVACAALAVTALAARALARPRTQVTTGAVEMVWRGRTVPFGIGVAALLVTPWASGSNRSALFLVAVSISMVGVCLALPVWFGRSGAHIRTQRPLPLFIAGARLARFPRAHARGWAAMAAACALFAPPPGAGEPQRPRRHGRATARAVGDFAVHVATRDGGPGRVAATAPRGGRGMGSPGAGGHRGVRVVRDRCPSPRVRRLQRAPAGVGVPPHDRVPRGQAGAC